VSKMQVIADRLSKTYPGAGAPAVDGMSFQVGKGELFGLIGPDGAGKTTLFRILTTLVLPDLGTARVLGYDCIKEYREVRRRIGYMPGRFSLYQDLTVQENLQFFASLFGTSIQANYDIIRDIYSQLEPFRDRRAGQLSGGMKQKLALCCALVHRPELLVLDEPTTGVDTVSRKEFWEILGRLKTQGMTILVSTPYMDEATRCDRIALVQSGRILSLEAPEEIIRRYPDPLFAIRSDQMGRLLTDLRSAPWLKARYAFGETHHIVFNDPDSDPPRLMEALAAAGHHALHCERVMPTVEDCFIRFLN